MNFFLKETKIGVRVFGSNGVDYTVNTPLAISPLSCKLFATQKWQKLTEDELIIVAKLNSDCSYGKKRHL